MLFKNIFLYRFTKPIPWNAEQLAAALEENGFVPCRASESFRQGWIPAAPMLGEEFIYQSGRFCMLRLNKEERLLPASVINDELAKRVAIVEEKEQRKLRKKEKQALKDEVIASLLPKAFTRQKSTAGYIDFENGLLILDIASPTKADEFTSFLRESVGSLPIRFVAMKSAPAAAFTDWIKRDHCPTPFLAGDQCELRADDGSDTVIRCKGTESLNEVIANHLDAGLQVTQLALSWDDKISFVVSDDMTLKRIRYLDTFDDQLSEHDDDAASQFTANFSLMTLEFGQLLGDLLDALGGEDTSAIMDG